MRAREEFSIAIIYRRDKLKETYIEAFRHAISFEGHPAKLLYFDAKGLSYANVKEVLGGVSGILVPGGFGSRHLEGKLAAINYARINKIPFLGICLGMQLAVIEFAHNVLGIKDASSEEFDSNCTPVVSLISQLVEQGLVPCDEGAGRSIRFGQFDCNIISGSQAHSIYASTTTIERHKHKYEFNSQFKDLFVRSGMIISGTCAEGKLVEIIELADHPWFLGAQFHPELNSAPGKPHPLFVSFVRAASRHSALNLDTSRGFSSEAGLKLASG